MNQEQIKKMEDTIKKIERMEYISSIVMGVFFACIMSLKSYFGHYDTATWVLCANVYFILIIKKDIDHRKQIDEVQDRTFKKAFKFAMDEMTKVMRQMGINITTHEMGPGENVDDYIKSRVNPKLEEKPVEEMKIEKDDNGRIISPFFKKKS